MCLEQEIFAAADGLVMGDRSVVQRHDANPSVAVSATAFAGGDLCGVAARTRAMKEA